MSGEDETIRRALVEGGICHAKHYGTFDFSPAHDALDALDALVAVVAAQREALQRITKVHNGATARVWAWQGLQAAAALDVEEVSEPDKAGGGESADSRSTRPGSLTSPVDTAPRRLRKHGPKGWWHE